MGFIDILILAFIHCWCCVLSNFAVVAVIAVLAFAVAVLVEMDFELVHYAAAQLQPLLFSEQSSAILKLLLDCCFAANLANASLSHANAEAKFAMISCMLFYSPMAGYSVTLFVVW